MTATRTVHHDERRSTQDFAPVIVRDCELSEPILAIDGRSIQSPVDLLEHLQRVAVGTSATLSVVRGGTAH